MCSSTYVYMSPHPCPACGASRRRSGGRVSTGAAPSEQSKAENNRRCADCYTSSSLQHRWRQRINIGGKIHQTLCSYIDIYIYNAVIKATAVMRVRLCEVRVSGPCVWSVHDLCAWSVCMVRRLCVIHVLPCPCFVRGPCVCV